MNKSKLIIILFLIFINMIFINIPVKAATFTPLPELPHKNILTTYQDSIGYIWFGTQTGLIRYDGYNFKTYKHNSQDEASISGNVVHAIYEDSDGFLWIGTEGGGLNRFDREKQSFKKFLPGPGKNNISHSIVRSITEDLEGNIWIGTYGGGVDKYNKKTKEFTHYKHIGKNKTSISGNIINVIYRDSRGNIWIGTEGKGLNKYLKNKDAFKRYPYSNIVPEASKKSKLLSGDTVNSILEDSSGNLWIGTWGGGLNKFIESQNTFYHYRKENRAGLNSNIIRSIAEDKEGNLWLGSWDGGASKYNPQQNKFTGYQHNLNIEGTIESNTVWSVFVDRSGIVWLGTWGAGINKYVWSNNLFEHYQYSSIKNSLNNNNVSSFYEDDSGNIWIGTLGGGLNKFNPKTREFKHFTHDPERESSLPNNMVRTIYQDSEGRLWIGTDKGLALYQKDENKFKTYTHDPQLVNSLSDNRIYAIHEDKFGDLWIGTWSGGINKFNFKEEKFTTYNVGNSNLSANNVWEIYEDSKGLLWVGTTYGLNLINRGNDRFTRFTTSPNKKSISANSISDIFEDSRGQLWVATLNGGLNLLDRKNMSFKHFAAADGLVTDNIKSILESDKQNLWLSSNKGLMCFDPKSLSVDHYNTNDQLQSNNFNQNAKLKSQAGKLYFGGNKGFNVFAPQKIKHNDYKPPVVLTSLKQNRERMELNKSLSTIDKLTLDWENNSFEFEFAALNFIQNSENEYAYMLAGFDEEWNYIGQRRFGEYTNLPAGTYILKIKAANNDGLWNNTPFELKVEVIPPFWQKTWFKLLIAVIILLLIYIIYRIKVHAIKKKNQELVELVEKRTQKIIEKNRALEKMSRTDNLTKLPNRRHILEKIKEEIARQKRHKNPFSIIMGDIDHFKKFNDNYGHKIGDQVLEKVGSLIKEVKREEDFAARWGGEEFLILLPETNIKEAHLASERIRKEIMNMECKTDNKRLKITITFGITEYDLDLSIEENINRADKALYQGKKQGRNCSVIFEEES
jgi:diguanylate cyclase (GGDEF)-like protein